MRRNFLWISLSDPSTYFSPFKGAVSKYDFLSIQFYTISVDETGDNFVPLFREFAVHWARAYECFLERHKSFDKICSLSENLIQILFWLLTVEFIVLLWGAQASIAGVILYHQWISGLPPSGLGNLWSVLRWAIQSKSVIKIASIRTLFLQYLLDLEWWL